jgi:hypothetical protein
MADAVAAPSAGIPKRRLYLAYGSVGLLLVAVAIVAVVLLWPTHHKPFSTWKPAAVGTTAQVKAIVNHVGAEYRRDGGGPLLGIVPTGFRYGGSPITRVGIGDPKTNRAAGLDTTTPTSVQMYFLCNTLKQCPLSNATTNQVALMQAEGFETALYALKTMPFLQAVLVPLPSDLAKPPVLGMYVRRANVAKLLDTPLSKTLGWTAPPRPSALSTKQAEHLNELTAPYTFKLRFTPFTDGQTFGLVLLPLAAS